MPYLVEPLDLVVHNQPTECFVILRCHNTFAKSYHSQVGLISHKRRIPVTVFAVFLGTGYRKLFQIEFLLVSIPEGMVVAMLRESLCN